jgi:hypothetical protein
VSDSPLTAFDVLYRADGQTVVELTGEQLRRLRASPIYEIALRKILASLEAEDLRESEWAQLAIEALEAGGAK